MPREISIGPASEEFLGFDQSRDSDVLKDGRRKQGLAAGISSKIRALPLDRAVAGKHFRNCSHITGLTKDIPQSSHQPLWYSTVDLRIDTVDVTRGSLRSVAPAIKNEDPVLTLCNVRTVKGETQFNRHVESWNPAGVVPARLKKITSKTFHEPSWELNMARKDAGLMIEETTRAHNTLAAIPAIAAEMDRWIAKGHGHDDWTVIGKDAVE